MIYVRPTLFRMKNTDGLYIRKFKRGTERIWRFIGLYRPVRPTFIPGVYVADGWWLSDYHDRYTAPHPSQHEQRIER